MINLMAKVLASFAQRGFGAELLLELGVRLKFARGPFQRELFHRLQKQQRHRCCGICKSHWVDHSWNGDGWLKRYA